MVYYCTDCGQESQIVCTSLYLKYFCVRCNEKTNQKLKLKQPQQEKKPMARYTVEFTMITTKNHKVLIEAKDSEEAIHLIKEKTKTKLQFIRGLEYLEQDTGFFNYEFRDITAVPELMNKIEAMDIVIGNLDPEGPLYETLMAIRSGIDGEVT